MVSVDVKHHVYFSVEPRNAPTTSTTPTTTDRDREEIKTFTDSGPECGRISWSRGQREN